MTTKHYISNNLLISNFLCSTTFFGSTWAFYRSFGFRVMDCRSYAACPGGSLYGSYPQGLVGNTKMYTTCTFTEYGHPSAAPVNNPYTIVFLGKIRDLTPGYSNFNLINSCFQTIEKHPGVTGIDKLPLKRERIVEHGVNFLCSYVH